MLKLRTLALAALSLAAALAHAQDINFGIIATDSASTQRDRWEPFFRDMEKKTGLSVKSFYAPDYAGVIEAMRFNKIQVAWYGNKSAMEAVDRANGEVFAQVMFADGSFGYKSLLITRSDSPLKSWEDVVKNGKSLNFGIGDPNSTSGFLVPTFYLFSQNKIDYRTASRRRAMPATAPISRRCWLARSTWPPTTPKRWTSSRPASPNWPASCACCGKAR